MSCFKYNENNYKSGPFPRTMLKQEVKHLSTPYLIARDESARPKQQVNWQIMITNSSIRSTYLRPFCVPGTVLGADDTAVNKTDNNLCPGIAYLPRGKKTSRPNQ